MAYENITVDPGRKGGLPCIRDSRVTVSAILGQLAAGRSVAVVLEDYSYLTDLACGSVVALSTRHLRVRRLPL